MLIYLKTSYLDSSSSAQASTHSRPHCPFPFATTLLTALGLILLSIGAAGLGGTVHLHPVSSINMLVAGSALLLIPAAGSFLRLRQERKYAESEKEICAIKPKEETFALGTPAKKNLREMSSLQLNSPAKLKSLPSFSRLRYFKCYDVGVCYRPSTSLADNEWFKILRAQWKDSPFIACLADRAIAPSQYTYSIDTNRQVYKPTLDLLRAKSAKYSEKYDIQIVLEPIEKLPNRLRSLNNQTTLPKYVGLLVSEKSEDDWENITPVLLFLPGDRNLAKVEAIVCYSSPQSAVVHLMKGWGVTENNLFLGPCLSLLEESLQSLGSLVLLRNALLSIKNSGGKNGFQIPLESAEIDGNKIVHFPPDWDYTALMPNPLLNEGTVVPQRANSRDAESCELAIHHREKYKKIYSVFCEFVIDKSPKFIPTRMKLPTNVSFYRENYRFKLEFIIELPVSNYLKKKGKNGAKKKL